MCLEMQHLVSTLSFGKFGPIVRIFVVNIMSLVIFKSVIHKNKISCLKHDISSLFSFQMF